VNDVSALTVLTLNIQRRTSAVGASPAAALLSVALREVTVSTVGSVSLAPTSCDLSAITRVTLAGGGARGLCCSPGRLYCDRTWPLGDCPGVGALHCATKWSYTAKSEL